MNLWHGKVQTAGTHLQWLIFDCAQLAKHNPDVRNQAQKALARCYDLYSYLLNNSQSVADQLWSAISPRSADLDIPRRGLCRRHRQCAHGQTQANEMVAKRRPQRGHHASRRPRWAIVSLKHHHGSINPQLLPTPDPGGIPDPLPAAGALAAGAGLAATGP